MTYEKLDRLIKKDLISHPTLNGYFKHPYLEDIYCSTEGSIVRDSLFVHADKRDKYKHIRYKGVSKLCHILIAETFLEKPIEITKSVLVNHKNGIKGDFRLDNLEWITANGNAQHAYVSGLRKDNLTVLVKDLRTGQVTEYNSLQSCSRFFGVNGSRINYILKPERWGIVQFNYYLIIKKGDNWPEGGPELIKEANRSLYTQVVVYSVSLKNFTLYDTVEQASKYTGINRVRLFRYFRKTKSANKTQFQIDDKIFINLIDFEMDRFLIPDADKTKITKVEYIHSKKRTENRIGFRKPIPIEVLDLQTGERTLYDSTEIFTRKLGIRKNTFQKFIYLNKGVWKNKYKISYLK